MMKQIGNIVAGIFENKIYLKLILIFLTFIIYIPVLDNDFSTRDDSWMLYNNEQVYSLDAENIVNYFTSVSHGQYSPINTLCYGIIFHFADLDPLWYFLFTLALHITNVLLVLAFIENLLNLAYKRNSFNEVAQSRFIYAAFFTALLFAVHPMQIESVAWISASKIPLFSLFFLLGLISYIKYIDHDKKLNLILSLIFFIFAYGSKEQAVVFPLCLILIDYFLNRNIFRQKVIIEKIPFILIASLFGLLSIYAQDVGFHNMLENRYYPFWQRLILANFSFNEYIFKLIAPVNLAKFYRFPMAVGESFPIKYWFYPLLVIVLLSYAVYWFKVNRKYILFGLGFFSLNLALTLHIVPMGRTSFIADRYVYLSCIGSFFIMSIFILKFHKNLPIKSRILLNIVCSIYLIMLISYTCWRTYHWS